MSNLQDQAQVRQAGGFHSHSMLITRTCHSNSGYGFAKQDTLARPLFETSGCRLHPSESCW